jgi:hypothetical protein
MKTNPKVAEIPMTPKLTYFLPQSLCYNIDQCIPELEKVLSALPDQGHLTTLKEYAVEDRLLLYKMAARFLPLTYEETRALIQGIIRYEKDGDPITEAGKENVERVTIVLMRRARAYREAGEFLKAAELAFAVLTTIEPEREEVSDDDWVYETIIEDAGDFITELAEEVTDGEVIQQLYEMVLGYTKSWKPKCPFFKQDCKDWKKALKKGIAPKSALRDWAKRAVGI